LYCILFISLFFFRVNSRYLLKCFSTTCPSFTSCFLGYNTSFFVHYSLFIIRFVIFSCFFTLLVEIFFQLLALLHLRVFGLDFVCFTLFIRTFYSYVVYSYIFHSSYFVMITLFYILCLNVKDHVGTFLPMMLIMIFVLAVGHALAPNLEKYAKFGAKTSGRL